MPPSTRCVGLWDARPADRAVSIVVRDDDGAVLVIRRQKNGRRYCVLPGGGVEDGESPRDAALRELREETGLSGQIVRELWTIQHPDRTAHYFLVSSVASSLQLGEPELALQSPANRHRPGWLELSEIEKANLQPAELGPLLADLVQRQTPTADD